MDERWHPRFLVIVAQRSQKTRFVQTKSFQNLFHGTVIDSEVCHPKYYDFFLSAHAVTNGTTKPVHYHVLWDEIPCSPDDLQELVHSLSYICQRSSAATSVVAPIRYAHLAARQFQFSDASPRLQGNINSMFFC